MINMSNLLRALCGAVILILLGPVTQAKGEDFDYKQGHSAVHEDLFTFNTGGVDAIQNNTREGFLKPTRSPRIVVGSEDPLFDRICESAKRFLRPLNCAPTLTDRVMPRNFLPPVIIAPGYPHLRLDIVLARMENKAVSGGGIAQDPNDLNDDLYATWKIQSVAATSSIPGPGDEAFGLPVPNPGEVWSVPHGNGLFQGIISNGCSKSTVFDVDLVSEVIRVMTLSNTTLGAVHLQDETVGNGFYIFSYTIRATDANGNVSDFIISGDARAYCTDQASF